MSSLGLKDENGAPLTLDADGEGSLKEYVKHIVMESAQRALDGGVDLADKTWLTIENGKVQSMDFAAYVKDITRMKTELGRLPGCDPAHENRTGLRCAGSGKPGE